MNRFSRPGSGWIEAVTGSMFSGKSEELIRRVRRAQIARQRVQIFKPKVDDRYATDHIVSHSDMKLPSQVVACSKEILEHLDDRTEVVGIDEGQFFDAGLLSVVNGWPTAACASSSPGSTRTTWARPFDPMPQILAVAEYVDKILAICMQCGAPANRTQRLTAATTAWSWGARRSTRRAAGGASSPISRWWPLSSPAPDVPKRNT